MAARKSSRQRNQHEYRARQLQLAKSSCRDYGDPDGFQVQPVDDDIGDGVFTRKRFHSGDFLLEYHGDLIKDHRKALKLEREYTEAGLGCFMYFFKFQGKSMCLDATDDIFRQGRMVNDAPKGDPKHNCEPKIVIVEESPHICFFASRDIDIGEELRFDYGDNNLPWRKKHMKNPYGEQDAAYRGDLNKETDVEMVQVEQSMSFSKDEEAVTKMAVKQKRGEQYADYREDLNKETDVEMVQVEQSMSFSKDEEAVTKMAVKQKREFATGGVKWHQYHQHSSTLNVLGANIGSDQDTDSNSDESLDDSFIDSDYVPDSESDELHEMSPQHKIYYGQTLNEVSDYTTSVQEVQNRTNSRLPTTNNSYPKSASSQMEPQLTTTEAEHVNPGPDLYNVMATNNSSNRVYDKKFNCLYCNVLQSKLPRHLVNKHADEKEVQIYMQEKDPKAKNDMLKKLRNLGNFHHNAQVIREQKGSLLVKYRPAHDNDTGEYLPCEFCYAYYRSSDLWKHVKRCSLAPSNRNKKSRRVVTSSRHLLPESAIVSSGLRKLLSTLSSDEVSRIVKNDGLILKFGEKMFKRHGHDKEQLSLIRTQMRELGRLLKELRNISENSNAKLETFIDPSLFQTLVNATHTVTGFSDKTNTFKTPSLALKIGHSLKKCCRIVEGEALVNSDEGKRNKCVSLYQLIEMNWTDEVSTHALRTLGERKRNKVKLLPLTNDVKLLNDHLKSKAKEAYKALAVSSSYVSAWSDLSKATLAQIILFNRRRQGEVSKMTLEDYNENHSAGEEDVSKALSSFEKELCKVFRRVEIVGKRGRTVPVILTNEIKSSIDLLLKSRADVGVSAENKFLFARPHYGSEGHIRGSDCIREYSEECGAERPTLLRSTKLRFQIATLSQILNLKDHELDLLADFLGHDIRVHREFYRLPEHTLQVAKVSKLLMALESGQIAKQAGKSLDEITIHADEEIDVDSSSECEMDEEVVQPMEISTSSKEMNSERDTSSSGKMKKIQRRPWTDAEKNLVFNYFQNEIILNKLPGKREIEECMRKHPLLHSRTWKNIKDCVRNKLASKKRTQLF